MTDASRNPDDYCYRHPDRLSFVLCERCGRTICLECQNHVDGRVLCPDDATARITNISAARTKQRRQRARRPVIPAALQDRPFVTYGILALTVLIFLVDAILRGVLQPHLWVIPAGVNVGGGSDVLHQPWSLVTSMFTGSILSVLLGGYSIYVFGVQIERSYGPVKLAGLYLISGFGASVVAFMLDGYVTSSFGAVMGLVAATVVLTRRMGGNHIVLYVSCAISLIFAIIFGGWQAVLGGFVTGGVTALAYFLEGDTHRVNRTRYILVAVFALLLVLAVLRAFLFSAV
ncbi:MAG TPA: rhomboid family intramembrane serine protease [Galbitalea sp.]